MSVISSEALSLSESEVNLLRKGLIQWGGPARATEEFAVSMGFASAANMSAGCVEICRSLEVDRSLTPRDWTRALLSLEIAFASDLVGSGVEWSTATGLSDEVTVRDLRSIQRKLAKVVFPVFRSAGFQAIGESTTD
jgi:hypothetical protein